MSEASKIDARYPRIVFAIALGIGLGGCAGGGTPGVPSVPGALPANLLSSSTTLQNGRVGALSRATKEFSIGLGAGVAASGNSSLPQTYLWCDGAEWYPTSVSQCPEKAGVSQYVFGPVTRTARLETASGQTAGYVTSSGEMDYKLGGATYKLSAVTDAAVRLKDAHAGAGANLDECCGGWMDTMYIASQTLKKGTAVTVGVKVALTPSTTSVGCDAAADSTGEVDLYAPFALDAKGTAGTEVTGSCIDGSFKYYLNGNFRDPGTTAVGTIATAVGDSVGLYFAAGASVGAQCPSSGYCNGRIAAVLAGAYKFTITSISAGATYTTASGNKYN